MDEGPVYAICMTSQGDEATLNLWISGLQKSNHILGQVPTLFRLDPGPREQQVVDAETQREAEQPEEEMEAETEEELTRSHKMKQ